ncbi:hypothetical protein QW131_26305 [Roseibium salinum]|nr:hypothetical protein [Roseibium salinum]
MWLKSAWPGKWPLFVSRQRSRCAPNGRPSATFSIRPAPMPQFLPRSGVVRFAAMDGDDIVTAIVAAQSVQQVYRSLRMGMKGLENGQTDRFGSTILDKGGFDPKAPIECDVVKPGNAWLLTDGRGRRADLSEQAECFLVAQLLYLQELQNGRKSTLLLR